MAQECSNAPANILKALSARETLEFPVESMVPTASFLLCLANAQSAFAILCSTIEAVLPFFLFDSEMSGTWLAAEAYFMKEYLVHILTKVKWPMLKRFRSEFSNKEIQEIEEVVQLCCIRGFPCLLTNLLHFGLVVFMWDQLLASLSF
jgi:hypothetical protein